MIKLINKGVNIHFEGETLDELKVIKNCLKVDNPDKHNMTSYKTGKWDGFERFYNISKKTFPRGLLHIVEKSLLENSIEFELVGFDNSQPILNLQSIVFHEKFQSDQRDYSRDAILAFLAEKIGIIKIPTRGGKTLLAAEIIRILMLDRPQLKVAILTDASSIFYQNKKEISDFLKCEVGVIGGGQFDIKNINIAMIQTLQDKHKLIKFNKTYKQFLESVDFLIIDEVHEYSSKPRIAVLKSFTNSKICLSLSATPWKSTNIMANWSIMSFCGKVIYEIKEQKLIERKVLAENQVITLFNHISEYDSGLSYSEYKAKHVYNSEYRYSLIKKVHQICKQGRLKLLILSTSTVYGENISTIIGCPLLHGGDNMRIRDEAKKIFLAKRGGCIVATDIWKKGVTLPDVDVVLLVELGKEETNIMQKRGRVLGFTDEKQKALCIDIMDVDKRYFAHHCIERIKIYNQTLHPDNIIGFDDMDALSKYMIKYFYE